MRSLNGLTDLDVTFVRKGELLVRLHLDEYGKLTAHIPGADELKKEEEVRWSE